MEMKWGSFLARQGWRGLSRAEPRRRKGEREVPGRGEVRLFVRIPFRSGPHDHAVDDCEAYTA